jgi:anti-sigma regulatory factor (Ser/Thr protein kinase)
MDLTDPTPVAARRATHLMLDGSSLSSEAAEGLVGAVSEVVTNATLHGRPPVQVTGWVAPGRRVATVTITDHGPGPDDPQAGQRPESRDPGDGGFGLWLAHHMCTVTMSSDDHGFTVRLVAGS